MQHHTKKEIKFIIEALSVVTLIVLIVMISLSTYFSYRKSETIEKFINTYYQEKMQNQDLNLSIPNNKITCSSNQSNFISSVVICEAKDINVTYQSIPFVTIETLSITHKSPVMQLSVQDMLNNLNTEIKLDKINFSEEFLAPPSFVDQNVTQLFEEYIAPQIKDIDISLSYAQKDLNKINTNAPINITLNVKNKSLTASFDIKNNIITYSQPQNTTFETSHGDETISINQQAFFQSAKFCVNIKERDKVFLSLYNYYKMNYFLANNKERFNDYFLDIQSNELIDQETFKKQVSTLVDKSIKEMDQLSEQDFMQRENPSIFEMFMPFLQGFLQGYNSMCQYLSVPANKTLSLTKMNYLLQVDGEEIIDKVLLDLDNNFTKER